MKSIKSLLLGSATVLLTSLGVQAADVPAAEPVEYVKVCETYGVGFWYIPGTDTCIKLGGYVRAQVYVHESNVGEDNWGGNPFAIDSENDDDDDLDDLIFDDFQNDTFNLYARGLLNFDARTETAYGTLRSFIQIRGNAVDQDNPSVQLDLAFLQFAGFTGGLAPSFLDFATNSYFGDHIGDWNHDTPLFGYTYQFGGGVSFNVAIESGDRADTTAADFLNRGDIPINDDILVIVEDVGNDDLDAFTTIVRDHIAYYGGDETRTELPDLVAAVRINQGWGEAMVGGVIREVKGRARVLDTTTSFVDDEIDTPEADPDDDPEEMIDIKENEESYHEIGWAIVGGLKVNLPMIQKGDYVILRAGYGEGATRYVTNAFDLLDPVSDHRSIGRNSGVPEAVFTGDLFDGTDDFETTSAFSIYAGYTHYWTDEIRSSFTASYAAGDFEFDDTDWSVLTASANVIWSPVKNLDIGLELLYSARDFDDRAAAVLTDDFDSDGSDDAFGAIFRVQRNFGN